MQNYGPNDIDKYGAVKPGGLYALFALILSKQIFYLPMSLLAQRQGRASSGANIDMSWLTLNSYWELAVCIPGILLLVMLAQRKPEASNFFKSLWAVPHLIMLVGALAQLAVVAAYTDFNNVSTATLAVAVLNVIALNYALTSKRLKDVRAGFPAKKDEKE